jgi:hypothetical protein
VTMAECDMALLPHNYQLVIDGGIIPLREKLFSYPVLVKGICNTKASLKHMLHITFRL